MNVKTNTAQFIKAEVLSKLEKRGDTYHATVEVGHANKKKLKVHASGHMDKQPMVLVHTTSTSGQGPPRKRRYAKYTGSKMDIRKWVLEQPMVHSIYRGTFAKVDVFNRMTLGVRSMQHSVKCFEWWKRMFLALTGFCVTNSWLAYNIYLTHSGRPTIDQVTFRQMLIQDLFINPHSEEYMVRM